MIEISVRRQLGEVEVAVDIVAKGRLLALCGVSGSGKTSVLNMIAGLLRPDGGRIAIDGATFFDSQRGVDLPARRRRIGYVFQEARLFPHLTIQRNLTYGARFAGEEAKAAPFDDVVDLLGVRHLLSRRPAKLSGGEQQRVAIGRALLMGPRALLLDEPLSAIDDKRRAEIMALIEKLRDAFSIPIVLVSHRVSEVERLASDVATLHAGRLVDLRPMAA